MNHGDVNNFSKEIAVIFQKSNELINAFLNICDTVINFNVEEETELNLLSSSNNIYYLLFINGILK